MNEAVWLGVDPALGGGFAVVACQPTAEKLYVLDASITYGLQQTEQQIEIITSLARRYKATTVIIEADAQQKALGNDERLKGIAALLGFEIVPHLTRGVKLDAAFGVASMNQSFIKQEISIPWADEESRRRMDEMVKQLREWRPDVPTKRLRQDAVMALWFVWRRWMQIRKAQAEPPPPQRRPSWMHAQPYRRLSDLRRTA